jgi:hypothetical protein
LKLGFEKEGIQALTDMLTVIFREFLRTVPAPTGRYQEALARKKFW